MNDILKANTENIHFPPTLKVRVGLNSICLHFSVVLQCSLLTIVIAVVDAESCLGLMYILREKGSKASAGELKWEHSVRLDFAREGDWNWRFRLVANPPKLNNFWGGGVVKHPYLFRLPIPTIYANKSKRKQTPVQRLDLFAYVVDG